MPLDRLTTPELARSLSEVSHATRRQVGADRDRHRRRAPAVQQRDVERRVAIVETQAPLTKTGLRPARVAQADNVRAALALVATGAAPLGVVYATDALAEPLLVTSARGTVVVPA